MASSQDNLDKAESYLARFRQDGVSNHIDGQSVPAASGKTFETISPIDQSKLADVAHGGAADIDRAARALARIASMLRISSLFDVIIVR